MSAPPPISGHGEKARPLQVLGLTAVSRLGRTRPGGSPERRLAPKLFLRLHVIQQPLDYPFAVDGLESLPRGFPSERLEGSVDHGFVGFPDPRVGDGIDRFPLRKVESELAVHVLDRALLVGDVGVRVEDLGPDLPAGVGLDPREVRETRVVVGEDEGADPPERLPASI